MTEEIRIIGIEADRIGQPRNDGTPGAGLYGVPVKLSRTPTKREAQLLVEHWDRPSTFTTMHRPGILTISGTSLILQSTTIEEVRDYHAATLKLAVAATNATYARETEAAERVREAEKARADAHDAEVRKVATEISFD